MTLILAWRCPDGIVLHADSQETVPQWDGMQLVEYRKTVQKIVPEQIGQFEIIVAGSGNVPLIESFIIRLRRQLFRANDRTSLNDFVDQCENGLETFYKRDVRLCLDEDKQVKFILGARSVVTNEYDAWVTEGVTLRRIAEDRPELVGWNEPLYDTLARRFYGPGLTISQAVLSGIHLLAIAEDTANCVKSPFSAAIIKENGIWMEPDNYVEDMSTRLKEYEGHLNRLFLQCADTGIRVDELQNSISEFGRFAANLHRANIDAIVGQLTFEDLSVTNHPYRKLPSGIVEFGIKGFSFVHDPEITKKKIERIKNFVASLPEHPFYLKCGNSQCNSEFEYMIVKIEESSGPDNLACPECGFVNRTISRVLRYRKIGDAVWKDVG